MIHTMYSIYWHIRRATRVLARPRSSSSPSASRVADDPSRAMSTPTASSSSSSTSFVDARDDALLDVERANGARADNTIGARRGVDAARRARGGRPHAPDRHRGVGHARRVRRIYRQEALARGMTRVRQVAHEIWLGSESGEA